MNKDKRMMTNSALLSVAKYLNEEEKMQKESRHERRKESSCRIKITFKESEKARLTALARSQYLPLATFCVRAVMEYAENLEKPK